MEPSGWTAATAAQSAAVFVLSGLLEIGGGWFVWRGFREPPRRPWFGLLGAVLLAAYGFVSLLQPKTQGGVEFGRVFAVYGAVFIVMSYAWGVLLDGLRVDAGDVVGGWLALLGAAVAWFWPRMVPPPLADTEHHTPGLFDG